jgi:hypothetical protein
MACNRIERILQVICNSQKATGSTKNLALDCGRIPSYDQDAHGKAQSMLFFLIIAEAFYADFRQMTGGRFPVRAPHLDFRTVFSLYSL